MEALYESRQTFIRGRGSLQPERANIPFLKPELNVPLRAELRCIGH